MFQTFTGSARQKRQVNLSGRNAKNPFAPTAPSHNALANAQQERVQRQKEREQATAARVIQRVWRGYAVRRTMRDQLRRQWDAAEAKKGTRLYGSHQESLSQLQSLMFLFNYRDQKDVDRLLQWLDSQPHVEPSDRQSDTLYLRLEQACLSIVISEAGKADTRALIRILNTLTDLVGRIPQQTARNASNYYRTMADAITKSRKVEESVIVALLEAVTAPLCQMNADTDTAYREFAYRILTINDLEGVLGGQQQLNRIVDNVNCKLLAHAMAIVQDKGDFLNYPSMQESSNRLWLLSHFIYVHRRTCSSSSKAYASDDNFVTVVSSLMASLPGDYDIDAQLTSTEQNGNINFLAQQLDSLVNQESISGLVRVTNDTAPDTDLLSKAADARKLATYALTLLRFYPRRGDDIRMWLYIGSNQPSRSVRQVSAVNYFYQAAKSTRIFTAISENPRTAIDLLKSRSGATPGRWSAPRPVHADETDDAWRILLLFFELYTFVLKVMDDDEFFADAKISFKASEKALPLHDVKTLIVFLKNLGFAMYYWAADIMATVESSSAEGLSRYFDAGARSTTPESQSDASTVQSIAGLTGFPIDYVKGLVTGLLRMLYERDSRRPFLPKGHWLMTSRFEMDQFIQAVVDEEENRIKLRDSSDDTDDILHESDDEVSAMPTQYLFSARARQTNRAERLRQQQRKIAKKRQLQAVGPRLEILQNMPFFIPFETRVQIFREFVFKDQCSRRGGVTDPDLWRMQVVQNPFNPSGRETLERHHAKIRRQHEFEDAFREFYTLGDGLKEPIQITFVDQFDTVEAGIDGGGVTKEFLTSVTRQAFTPQDEAPLFIENDQNLLYPNPMSIEQLQEHCKALHYNSQEESAAVTTLLQQYEFLGRVVGKCLYEGILVDVHFAPFFLVKWALFGGDNSASKESAYRASINDLRDLDRELYNGLVKLKNYDGNVEDFGLNFTVTDHFTITLSNGRTITRNITKELRRGGNDIPVTNSNRLVYISYMARHRLQIQPYHQTNAFLRGLSTIIKPSWLNMFNQAELQTLLGGSSVPVNVPDLRRNTQYGGVYTVGDDGQEHPSIRLFWDVMEELSDEDRRAVLKFVTSTPRAPLLGFGSLNPRFSIRDAGQDQERLPTTSTCVNLLKLPMYKDKRTLKEKLLYAVNSGAGFDLS